MLDNLCAAIIIIYMLLHLMRGEPTDIRQSPPFLQGKLKQLKDRATEKQKNNRQEVRIMNENDIVYLLNCDKEEFDREITARAVSLRGNKLYAAAMLGYTNHCKNRCLYCGMSALCRVERYRIPADDIIETAKRARADGFKRLFLIAGEDPMFPFDELLRVTEQVKSLGFHLSLGCGELENGQYAELRAAGCDCYVMKFEMSDPDTFDRLNPSTSFERRMKGIEAVKKSGMELASGNIIDYPGSSPQSIARDILLTERLGVSWAPVVPYMPAPGTPLAKQGGAGNIELAHREFAILRVLMPDILITAQQPGKNLRDGLGGEEGNLAALNAGANILFADYLPTAKARAFSVISDRNIAGADHIRKMAELSGMKADIEC